MENGTQIKKRMKILIYGLNFSPELTGIGKYTGEMVQWLTQQGHKCRVISAPLLLSRLES